MRLKEFVIFVIFVLSFSSVSYAQNQSIKYYSKKCLSDDIDSLYSNINDIHPYMFSIVSRQEFEKKLEEVKQSLSDSMTIFEFYRQVAPLIFQLGDGHTSLHFPIDKLFEYDIQVFPFLVNINKTDSVATIVHDWSNETGKIPTGVNILSINGHECKGLIDECLNLTEGELHHFKVEILNRIFPFFLYSVMDDTVFTLKYIHKGEIFTKKIEGIEAKQYEENLDRFIVKDYMLSVDEKTNSAVIRFDGFGFDGDRFKNFLDSTFLLLKNKSIANLIIDLRNNGGGSSTRGDQLFQYISPVPFQQFGKTIVKVSDPVKQRYGISEKGIFIQENPLIPLDENPLRFEGDVYVLTSNFTFSSAASFAWSSQYYKMAKVVGEETGGLVVCFGNVFACVLPNSGLNYGVSWQKYYLYGTTEKNTGGVIPDYPVPANQAMEMVMDLISKKNVK